MQASPVAQMVNNLPATQETWVQLPGQEDPLQKGMATHSTHLALENSMTEEPGELSSMGSQRTGPDSVTDTCNTETAAGIHSTLWGQACQLQ